jgi:hypothetical protein
MTTERRIDLSHYDGTWGVNVTGYPELPRDQHAPSAGIEQAADVTVHRVVGSEAHPSSVRRTPRRHT